MSYDQLKDSYQSKTRRKHSNHESQLQIDCVKWFRMQHRKYAGCFLSVPNGGQRNIITAKILKAEGALPGTSDLILLVPNGEYHGLCIEMKYDKGKQSDNQKSFETNVTGQGFKYVICRTINEFMNEVNNYLSKKLFI